MNNLFEFVDFGDNNPTSATPSGRPKKSTTIREDGDDKSKIRKPAPILEGSKPPPKKIKTEIPIEIPIVEEIHTPIANVEIQTYKFDSTFDNSVTERYVKEFFKKSEKIGKDNLICYGEKKTMFGGKITALDKVKEVGIINADHADGSRFISTSFKLIKESEIPQLIKKYTTVGAVRNYPLLVAIQYMEDPQYNNVRIRIQDEFL